MLHLGYRRGINQMATAKTSKYLLVALASVALLAIALSGLSIAAITVNQKIPSSGTITAGPNVGIYANSACTTAVSSITWGALEAGGSTSQTIYVKNTGGAAMTLSLAVGSWSPTTASNYISITCTEQGVQIAAGQSVEVTLTLTVSSAVTGITTFSNSITITGTG